MSEEGLIVACAQFALDHPERENEVVEFRVGGSFLACLCMRRDDIQSFEVVGHEA